MPYPSANEFKHILLTTPLDVVVQDYVFQETPFVFRGQPELMLHLRRHLCAALPVAEENITVVGSAKMGFSLSPDAFPRRFTDRSDIDVIIVNEPLFDQVWTTVIQWHYPRRTFRLGEADWRWASGRMKELYWGWFTPDKIRYEGLSFPQALTPLRDLSTAWFNAFQSLSQYPEFASRQISGRLYRTWHHALLYHADGLQQIKSSLSQARRGGP